MSRGIEMKIHVRMASWATASRSKDVNQGFRVFGVNFAPESPLSAGLVYAASRSAIRHEFTRPN